MSPNTCLPCLRTKHLRGERSEVEGFTTNQTDPKTVRFGIRFKGGSAVLKLGIEISEHTQGMLPFTPADERGCKNARVARRSCELRPWAARAAVGSLVSVLQS